MIREESEEERVVHEGHEGHEEETKDKKEGDQMELLYRDEVYAIVGRGGSHRFFLHRLVIHPQQLRLVKDHFLPRKAHDVVQVR